MGLFIACTSCLSEAHVFVLSFWHCLDIFSDENSPWNAKKAMKNKNKKIEEKKGKGNKERN